MDKQQRYQEERQARARAKLLTDEELATSLLTAAEAPRRFDKATNKALAYEAALRLRRFAQLPTGETGNRR